MGYVSQDPPSTSPRYFLTGGKFRISRSSRGKRNICKKVGWWQLGRVGVWKIRSSHRGAGETNPPRNHEVVGLIPGLAQWIWRCRELQCRSQRQLRSSVTVALAQAGSCSSDWTLSLGHSMCHWCGPNKQTNKKSRV